MKRNRLIYSGITAGVLLLGLLSRRFADELPFIRAYVGDALWALMVFCGLATLFNRQPTKVIALLTGLFSFGIEIGQLYHAPWIDALRATRLGGLILGYSFLWTDLLCYCVGILIGSVIDWQLNTHAQQQPR